MKSAAVVFAILLTACASLCAQETILDFQSHITVQPNGELFVRETITFRAEGDQIQRGIYRDFPTFYQGRFGLRSRVPFEVVSVTRDGKPEPWHTEKQSNGVRIYIGDRDTLLSPGVYTCTLEYRTAHQLGFFDQEDSLYWNVTGNGWVFPIEKASACVELPPGAPVRSVEAWTGPMGAQDTDYRIVSRSGCDACIETTRTLSPEEGLTIRVNWPGGIVHEPRNGTWKIVQDNPGVFAGLGGLFLALLYYLIAWHHHGRDPERGVIIPLYAPPEGMTPQDVRYLRTLGRCDTRSFAAAIIHLAVQRALKIKESRDGCTLISTAPPSPLAGEEARFHQALFRGKKELKMESGNHHIIRNARAELKKTVAENTGQYFRKNTSIWVIGLVITLIPLGISLFDAQEIGSALFLLFWLSFWSLGCAVLSINVLSAWSGKNKWKAIPITLFSVPFFFGWIFGFVALIISTSLWVAAIYAAGIGMAALFQYLLKAPTPEGQKRLDQIEGFRDYLQVAEKDRLHLENPPERTPEHFEKFLPYALALGVEQKWAEQFAHVAEMAAYDPDWHSGGRTSSLVPAAYVSSLSRSLNTSISSASVAPGSSSGGGGSSSGRSSGGGGGGGGGGGW